MFTKDSNGALQYETQNNVYSLLEGIDDKGYTSDIVFIYKEPLNKEGDMGDFENGAIIDWCYGAFRSQNGKLPIDELCYIEEKIKEYEKKEEENK